jgi:GntR family transcriptional regulator/MocR family aminotransferase
MKKALNEYHRRRDFMCSMLMEKLPDVIQFRVPDGGLAIWARFDKSVPLPALADKMREQGIIISNGLIHNNTPVSLNSTRMGFAWMNEKEAAHAIEVLEECVHYQMTHSHR